MEIIDIQCPKCGKICKAMLIDGFSCTVREKGSTGHSHLVTRKKAEKISGECECGYKLKKRDMDDCL